MTKFVININGEIKDENSASISVLDRGFLYGDSVYEVTRTFNKIPLRLDKHIERLFSSAQKIFFCPKITKEQIKKEVLKTIAHSDFDNAFIRLVLTRGVNSDLGLDPDLAISENLIIYIKELHPNPKWWYDEGVKLKSYQKESSSKGSLPKTGNYVINMLAYKEAISNSFYDALMINSDGTITECTTSNIWIVKDGKLLTPSLEVGILPGITRSTIVDMNYCPTSETILKIDDFYNADECFITSTTREIVPVVKIDQLPIGNGKPGKITLSLIEEYKAYILRYLLS
jgi:branched-chain amino acid aminotransferase